MAIKAMASAAMQATMLSTISNIAAQVIEANRDNVPFHLDPAQLLRFMLLTILTAPPNYLWQGWLEKTFPGRKMTARTPVGEADAAERGESVLEIKDAAEARVDAEERKPQLNYKNTAIKWFVDCMTIGALGNTIVFLVLMGLMKGRSGGEISAAIQKETIPIIVAGYKIWPLASVVSFSLIPVEKRIVFLSAVGLVWGVYMSLVAARQ